MIVVTLWEHEGEQRFAVHATNEDGSESIDVTEQYQLHLLTVEDENGALLGGWHVAKKIADFSPVGTRDITFPLLDSGNGNDLNESNDMGD